MRGSIYCPRPLCSAPLVFLLFALPLTTPLYALTVEALNQSFFAAIVSAHIDWVVTISSIFAKAVIRCFHIISSQIRLSFMLFLPASPDTLNIHMKIMGYQLIF